MAEAEKTVIDLRQQPGPEPKYTVEEIQEAVTGAGGIVAAAAGKLGCSVQTIYNYTKKHPELWETIHASRARTDRMVVGKLLEGIQKGNTAMIIFYLKTRMGWRETANLQIAGRIEQTVKAVDSPAESAEYWGRVINELNTEGFFAEGGDSTIPGQK